MRTQIFKRIVFPAFVMAGIVGGPVASASAADATASASADIVQAAAIAKVADLAFGSIVPDATNSDTVLVSTGGAVTCGANLSCTGSGTAAGFDVTGSANQTYSITLPASIAISSGANSMTVNTFVDSEGGTGTLDGSGVDNFTVGATLNVNAAQAQGSYTGNFTVTVDYN